MSSILKVDNLQTGAGATHSISSLGVISPGTVLQQIYGICDGRTVSGIAFQDVTAPQSLTTSHVEMTGSSVSYTPPTGATTVVYSYTFHFDATDNGGISHYQFMIDGTAVSTLGRRTHAGAYQSNSHTTNRIAYEFPILIDSTIASDDIPNLKLKSWTSARTLSMTAREYSSSYDAVIHQNVWWDGAGAGDNQLSRPTLSIKAIA